MYNSGNKNTIIVFLNIFFLLFLLFSHSYFSNFCFFYVSSFLHFSLYFFSFPLYKLFRLLKIKLVFRCFCIWCGYSLITCMFKNICLFYTHMALTLNSKPLVPPIRFLKLGHRTNTLCFVSLI